MGQNLMRTDCAICEGEVMLEEEARPIRPTECVGHEREHVGLLTVACARCRACGTLYLAWVKHDDPDFGSWLGGSDDESFVDLSFRHSFGVRPDSLDLPSVEKLREVHHAKMRADAAERRADAAILIRSADAIERDVAAGEPSPWESASSRRYGTSGSGIWSSRARTSLDDTRSDIMDRTDLSDFTRLLPDGAQDHPAFMAFFLVTRRRVYARPALADHWAWFSEGWDQHRQWATTSSSDFLDGRPNA